MNAKPPTESGWYWVILHDRENPEVVYYDGETVRTINGMYHPRCVKNFYYPKLKAPQ